VRKLVKRLLKKYKYPPEEAKNAMEIVLRQCAEPDFQGYGKHWQNKPAEKPFI
jgi:type I restriction enzyme R subunit